MFRSWGNKFRQIVVLRFAPAWIKCLWQTRGRGNDVVNDGDEHDDDDGDEDDDDVLNVVKLKLLMKDLFCEKNVARRFSTTWMSLSLSRMKHLVMKYVAIVRARVYVSVNLWLWHVCFALCALSVCLWQKLNNFWQEDWILAKLSQSVHSKSRIVGLVTLYFF